VLGTIDLDEFAGDAAVAAHWTRRVLAEPSRSFLLSLSSSAAREGVELFHASPRDPVWEYVLSAEAASAALELTEAPLVLVGHSHVPLAITLEGDVLDGGLAPDGTETALAPGRRLLNPGSVGQPRDGDPRACYMLYDEGRETLRNVRLEYDVDAAMRRIRAAGLPEFLAERLQWGE
jgi:diadenosine tetraphosphatase ApaH/serine/threonine PP2A family protein phosphatase